jgi:hypothetical protein
MLRSLLEKILPQKNRIEDFEIKLRFPDKGERIILLNARQIINEKKAELKNRMFDYLGGACKRCNNDDRRVLCFHHLDPLQKKFDVSTKWNLNYKKLKIELDKCILLCRNCHSIVHLTRDPEYLKISEFCFSTIEDKIFCIIEGLEFAIVIFL